MFVSIRLIFQVIKEIFVNIPFNVGFVKILNMINFGKFNYQYIFINTEDK